jgi:hypothetical protein
MGRRYDVAAEAVSLGAPLLADHPLVAECVRSLPRRLRRSASDRKGKRMATASSGDLESRQIRAATNQSLFREVNEQIERLHGNFEREEAKSELAVFLCECAEEHCTEQINLSLDDYETIRRVPTHFLVRRGHNIPDVERIVAEHDGFSVVEKFSAAGSAAVRLDPRRRSTNSRVTAEGHASTED